LNPEIDVWLPNSTTTIRTWVIQKYKDQKQIIQAQVQSALSKIHFTVDIWTSTNQLAIIDTIAHYITESEQLTHSVLALRELSGEHSGENQASLIIDIINEYGIASKVGYFVMDNATNNDTLVISLSKRTLRKT
jgi:hypothetical protein